MKNKKVMLIGMAAAVIVLIGILLALLLTPVTTFLYGGTGDDFRTAGTCSARKESPEPTMTPDPEAIFIVDATPSPEADMPTLAPDATATPEPIESEPTIAPIDALYEMADTSMMKDIVNILLIGVDFSDERLTWNGKKEWHSDVMIVLSVNFEENRADLISLPRDTYAKIPGVDGIYKLNAAINCGGGLYNDDGSANPAGLEKVCEAAKWMLGGIPVDYYYAVTMTSLKSLVDVFGGLDYDMDIDFTIQGRSYKKGLQHMNGQAVLDYCRVRKAGNGLSSGETGDANRVNRQKRILVAFFEEMQKNNLIVKIPEILASFEGDLFTNCTAGQTAALAAFAYNLNRDDIGLYSMSGSTVSLFQWNFTFTDQANRVDIIKKVYGVDAKQYRDYTLKSARYRWASMLYDKYIELLDPLEDYVQELIDEDNKLPEFTSTPEPVETPAPTQAPTEAPTDAPTQAPTEAPTKAPTQAPTEAPTKAPTQAPTEAPTKAPTQAPTEAPTNAPTQTSTETPTQAPTEAPTPDPTPETITVTVKLDWDDGDNQDGLRPEELPVKLLANGKDTGKSVTIKENKKKWEAAFKGLAKTENGEEIAYTVEVDEKSDVIRNLKDAYTFKIEGSAAKGFKITCKHTVKATDAPTEAPTDVPAADPTDAPDQTNAETPTPDVPGVEETPETNTAAGSRFLHEEKTRKYTEAQRQLFEDYKKALAELKECKANADKEAKKSKKGSSNQLNSASVAYLNKLAEIQTLAIRVAQEFNYTKVKNFTVAFPPTGTGWKTGSPWAVNYGLNKKFNEVRVDFN